MIDIFTSINERSIFYIVIALWFLSEIVGGNLIPHLRRRGTKIKGSDKDSRLLFARMLFAIGIYVSLLIAYFFAINGIALLPSWSFYLGIIVMILGIMLRQWSIAILGPYFSGTIGTQKGQKVVDKCPYRLVRHPSYTGILLILVGLGLTLQSGGAVLLILLVFGCTFGYRIHIEEKLLISNLGKKYIEYMKRTKRLIPYVL
jgi:protein-S-isoprenylcysteine O-methyltransferase Ste14